MHPSKLIFCFIFEFSFIFGYLNDAFDLVLSGIFVDMLNRQVIFEKVLMGLIKYLNSTAIYSH